MIPVLRVHCEQSSFGLTSTRQKLITVKAEDVGSVEPTDVVTARGAAMRATTATPCCGPLLSQGHCRGGGGYCCRSRCPSVWTQMNA